jgi:hyperosmotically inducible periplasmic protein
LATFVENIIMKSSLLHSALLVGVLCAPVTVLAETHVVKDSAITVEVKSKLAAEHVGSLTNVHVDTDDNGVVWLKGTVETQAQADRAVELARDTKNVKSVHSDLMVKP